jgi:uncharacterized protein YihD (DUF1040 family)
MRDPARIERMLDLVSMIWQRHPDWRLGQLLANVSKEMTANVYFYEDNVLEQKLLQYFYDETPVMKEETK